MNRSWVYTGIKMLLPTKTTVKFMMLSNGEYLAAELGTKDVPKVYGGERDIKLEDEAIVLKSA